MLPVSSQAAQTLSFVKGHGTENDFVLIPDHDGSLRLEDSLVRRLADRRAGLGADGVIRVAVSYTHLDVYKRQAQLRGELTEEAAIADTARATRRLARRQESWFGADPRVRWLAADSADLLASALRSIRQPTDQH